MKDYRISASMLKKWKDCPFQIYCKITEQNKSDTDNSYGDAGNAVHTTIEYYYTHLHDLPLDLAFVELRNVYDRIWESINTNSLDIELYWLCVVNGVKRDVDYTDLEYKFEFDDPVSFLGYADVLDTKNHSIGDWKTATYKSKKVKAYEEQLKVYAWAYWHQFKVVPKAWVLFNKIDRLVPFIYSENDMWHIESLMRTTKELIEKGLASTDIRVQEKIFKRNPSRGNCFFCPYKDICSTDLLKVPKYEGIFEVQFHLKKEKLLIEGEIPEEAHKLIEQHVNFEVKNSHFIKQALLQKGVRWDGIKRLYKRKSFGGQTTIGYMQFCWKTLKEYAHSQNKKLRLILKDYRAQELESIETPDKLNTDFIFYDFQTDATKALIKQRWGIVEIGTGGGKTAIAADCIRQLKLKTLFVIDNKDLLIQTKKEYEDMIGIKCGIVGMGDREWDNPIVLATIQTLAKHLKEFKYELEKFGLVIFDETHIIAADSFAALSKYLTNTRYRFGFSATARRDDGNDNIIYANTGEIIYKKKADALIEEGVLVNPEIVFYKYVTQKVIAENWQNEYTDSIVKNETRNNIIKTIAEKYAEEGKQVMILMKDIKNGHMEWLKTHIINSEEIYGKTEDDIRFDRLERFKNKEFPILIGNIKIFNKGLNIKTLDVLINAAGNAGDVVTVQTIDRVLRKSEGKDKAYYIDFVDKGDYCFKHSISRINALRNEKYDVKIADWKT